MVLPILIRPAGTSIRSIAAGVREGVAVQKGVGAATTRGMDEAHHGIQAEPLSGRAFGCAFRREALAGRRGQADSSR